MKTKKIIALSLLSLLFIAVMINPIYGFDMYLQQAFTVFVLFVLAYDIRKSIFSWRGYLGLVLFTALHTFGARWLYTMVPYNDWCETYLGFSINDYFGWNRNHYDRLVHFVFGMTLIPVIMDLTLRWFKNIKWNHALVMSWLILQFLSLFYELFEWGLTFTLSPDQVENYNGQQGDMWDPHKDSVLALLGSSITTTVMYFRNRSQKDT